MLRRRPGRACARGAAQPRAAKTPCWRQVIDDWVDNDRIDRTYDLHCYREAIAHVPEDLRVYSGIVDDIRAARQQATRNVRRLAVNPPSATPPGAPTTPEVAKSNAAEPKRALFKKRFDKLGSRDADTVPLPLLILAGALAPADRRRRRRPRLRGVCESRKVPG